MKKSTIELLNEDILRERGERMPPSDGPLVMKSTKSVFVDVDDTLIMWEEGGADWKPNDKHIAAIKRHSARGHTVVVWSKGGWEWAEKAVKLLNIAPYVNIIMSKPDWFIDDQPLDKLGDLYYL